MILLSSFVHKENRMTTYKYHTKAFNNIDAKLLFYAHADYTGKTCIQWSNAIIVSTQFVICLIFEQIVIFATKV